MIRIHFNSKYRWWRILFPSPGSLISVFLPLLLFDQKNVSDFRLLLFFVIIAVLIFNSGFGIAVDWLP